MPWKCGAGAILFVAALATPALAPDAAHARDRTINLTRAAGTCMHAKDPDQRIAACNDCLEIFVFKHNEEQSAHTYYNRGQAYAQKDDLVHAIADLTQAIKYQPEFAEAHRERGALLWRNGDFDGGMAEFNEAIRLKPDYAHGFGTRGRAYLQLEQFAESLRDYDKAIALAPGTPTYLSGRCWTRAMWGRELETALNDCDLAIKLAREGPDASRQPIYDFLDSRATVYLRMGRFAEAIRDYDAALAAEPEYPSSLFNRGIAKLRIGDSTSGNADIAAAKRIDPEVAKDFARFGIAP